MNWIISATFHEKKSLFVNVIIHTASNESYYENFTVFKMMDRLEIILKGKIYNLCEIKELIKSKLHF